jgi:PBP1b-binding outer membrane lipoprotein LpoB
MKKAIIPLLVGAMVLLLAGCGEQGQQQQEEQQQVERPPVQDTQQEESMELNLNLEEKVGGETAELFEEEFTDIEFPNIEVNVQLDETITYRDIISDSVDTEDCNQLESSTLIDSCKDEVVKNKAMQEMNLALCDKINDQEIKKQCEDSVSEAKDKEGILKGEIPVN